MPPMTKKTDMPKVGMVSLGCPKALTDSELILTRLSAEGYQTSKTFEGADLVIVNTCGFIDSAVKESLDAIGEARENSQPLRTKTGGSTFKNPPGGKAWELVDRAGLRGFRMGDAQVSEKHTNFLINTGDATAADIEALGEEVRRRVFEQSGVRLEWEIRRIGEML